MEMSRVETSLTRLEAALREIIEGDASIPAVPQKLHRQVMRALVQALHREMKKIQSTNHRDKQPSLAPDLYTIILPASQATLLLNHPTTLNELAWKLEIYAARANLKFAGAPILRIVPDPGSSELHILVEYSHAGEGKSYTTETEDLPTSSEGAPAGRMPDAFLIVNGVSMYPLTSPVINIGSDPSNQLVITDPSVSPLHAQIRFSTGRFVVFDLDSRHGTYVNGHVVSSHALKPGDVIRLAGVPLVYGQETTPQLKYTMKMPAEPPALEVLEG